eukprot:6372192-Pyramimonas_sp.AAC.1
MSRGGGRWIQGGPQKHAAAPRREELVFRVPGPSDLEAKGLVQVAQQPVFAGGLALGGAPDRVVYVT